MVSYRGPFVLLTTVLLTILGLPDAHATNAGTLPRGSFVGYAGLGVNTYSQRNTVNGDQTIARTVDRAMRYRFDLYYANGLTDRLMLSASIPVVHSTVIDDPDEGPCGTVNIDGYCDPITTIGSTRVELRYKLVDGPLTLSPLLALGAEPWNKDVRWRFTAMGDGTVDLLPGMAIGKDLKAGQTDFDVNGWVAYAYRFGSLIEDGPAGSFRAPGDDVRGGVAVHVQPAGKVSFELGADALQRLWGLDWDDGYQDNYFPTDDRWTVLYYSHIAASAKVSVELPNNMGLHVGVNRVLVCANGPSDTTDFTIGLHRYHPPKHK